MTIWTVLFFTTLVNVYSIYKWNDINKSIYGRILVQTINQICSKSEIIRAKGNSNDYRMSRCTGQRRNDNVKIEIKKKF